MDSSFPDWYGKAYPEASGEIVALRWRAVEFSAGSLRREDVPDLTRLFLGRSRSSDDTETRLREAIQAQDPSSGMEGNDHEVRVLAGATIAEALKHDDVSNLVALAAVCSGLQKSATTVPVPAILDRLEDYLRKHGSEVRRRPELTRIAAPNLEFSEEIQKIEAVPANQASLAAEPLKSVLAKTSERLSKLGRDIQRVLTDQANFLAAQDEELNILWWVFGGVSTDAERPFRELKLGEAALRAGKELADRTRLIPGPPAILAFLDRALLAVKSDGEERSISLAEAISESPRERRESLVSKSRGAVETLRDIAPVSFALIRSVETADEEDWRGPFEEITGIKATTKLPAIRIATQHYHEQLLIRVFSEVGE